MVRTHYRVNPGDEPACGHNQVKDENLTRDWNEVDCKNCKKVLFFEPNSKEAPMTEGLYEVPAGYKEKAGIGVVIFLALFVALIIWGVISLL